MMAEITIDIQAADSMLGRVVAGVERLPTTEANPLRKWMQAYRDRENKAFRPTVNMSSSFRGNRWPGLEPAYTRVTDGVAVPVWGGVPRVQYATSSPLGVVTRAKEARPGQAGSIRSLSAITAGASRRVGMARRAAQYGTVSLGQVFSQRNVLGKLKSDGTRYKASDKQLGTRADGLWADWVASANPYVSSDGLNVVLSSKFAHSEQANEKRPFVWGPEIERVEMPDLEAKVHAYLGAL